MTIIAVSALLKDGDKALFAQRPDGGWELPSDELEEEESVDEALDRMAHQILAIEPAQKDFLDTYYERQADSGEPTIRSVYSINSWSGRPQIRDASRYLQLRWVGLDGIASLATSETQRAILRDSFSDSTDGPSPGAPITVITGPRAAGKSTIAGLLCTRLPRAAHIEVDLLRDMVIAAPGATNDFDDPQDASESLRLSVCNACSLARNFSMSGYEAIIDDVIDSTEALNLFLQSLSGTAPVYFITLLPDSEALEARDATREPELRVGAQCVEILRRFHRNGETRGLRVDTSQMSRSETVTWILANRDRARVL
jgi:chloramphenicol 3-O-phosphotransferase